MRCGVTWGRKRSRSGCGMLLLITVAPCWRTSLGDGRMRCFCNGEPSCHHALSCRPYPSCPAAPSLHAEAMLPRYSPPHPPLLGSSCPYPADPSCLVSVPSYPASAASYPACCPSCPASAGAVLLRRYHQHFTPILHLRCMRCRRCPPSHHAHPRYAI